MKFLVALCWVILIALLGYLPRQGDVLWIIGCYVPLFGLYIGTYRYFKEHHDLLFFVFLSIGLRCMLIFAFPNLSDDIYRFVWDGMLINDGVNPYLYTPTEYLELHGNGVSKYTDLYPHLNSKDYYSVYPPVCQLVFSMSTWLFQSHLFWATVVMKVLFVVAETLTIYFLLKLTQMTGINQQRVLLYALNPLIIIELTGNLHYEAFMILFLVLALWSFLRKRFKFFGIFMALSVAAKLLTLIFLPFFLRRARTNDLLRFFAVMGGTLFALFYPFLGWQLAGHLWQSINLYFQKFEFNASIYYLVRWVGYQIKGYNIIETAGPILQVTTFLIILILAFTEKRKSFKNLFEKMLLAITCYLFLATTVHPWYLAMPVMFTVFTYFRYPIFWSALICLTYVNYSYSPYHENLWVVALEYSIVFLLFLIEVVRLPLASIFVGRTRFIWDWLRPGGRGE